jgi:hypothetical protein
MQHVDRIAHVERLAEPARHRGPRVQGAPVGVVARSERVHGIAGHLRRRRDLGQRPAVRAVESKLAVRLSIEPIALFVDGAVMPATEQREIRERRGAALSPVTDVMALAEADPAAREAAAAVAMVERPP